MLDPLLSIDETRKALAGCSRNTVYRFVNRGHLPKPTKIGSKSSWRASDVQALIDRLSAGVNMGPNMGPESEGEKKAA